MMSLLCHSPYSKVSHTASPCQVIIASLIFVIKAGTYLSGAPYHLPFKGRLLVLSKIGISLILLLPTNTQAYELQWLVLLTFYGRNLRIFVIS